MKDTVIFNKIKYDYLAFTFQHLKFKDKIIEFAQKEILLKETDYIEKKGFNRYREQIRFENGLQVLYDGYEEKMGCHFILSGTPLKELSKIIDLDKLIYKIYSYNGKFSRLDLAIDINENVLKHLIDKVMNLDFTTRVDIDKNVKIFMSPRTNQTIYIGKRGNNKMVRIYNKADQQNVKFNWTRYEMEIKENEEILKVFNLINEKKINDYMKSFFRIVDKKIVGHSEREKIDKIYNKFFENEIPTQFEYEIKKSNKFIEWIRYSVIRTIAEIYNKMDKEEFINMLEDVSFEKYRNKFKEDELSYVGGMLKVGKESYNIVD